MVDSWRAGEIEGWGCYVFKEKLKRLKDVLKKWNKDHFGNFDHKIVQLREEIQSLDDKDDTMRLSPEEAVRRREVVAHLM